MTYTSAYQMDPRQHIAALVNRNSLDARLVKRPDVVGHGASLIEVLRCRGDEQKAKALNLAEHFDPALLGCLSKRLIKFVEFDHRLPLRGSAVPAGVRCSTYVFSVPLQVAAEQAKDRRVGGIPIWRLPISRNELLGHLYASIGLWLPTTLGSFAMSDEEAQLLSDQVGGLFSQRFGFAMADLADRLLRVLVEDPDLYILILSREWALIAPHLQDAAALTPDKVIRKPIGLLTALETVFELQRAAIMTWALRHWRALNLYSVRDHIASNNETAREPALQNQHIADMFVNNSGFLPTAEVLMMQAATLRRYLRWRPNPLVTADLNWLHDAAAHRSLCWNQPQWARTPKGAGEILTALQAQASMLKRVKGKGQGYHNEPLDTFCGISAYQLPLLAVMDLGRRLTGRSDDGVTNAVASIMHRVLLGPNLSKYGSAGPEHARRQALKFGKTYLPAAGSLGSGGRFDPSFWRNTHRDKPLFQALADYMYNPEARRAVSRNLVLRRIGLALLFMARRFQQLYRATKVTSQMVKITCDLATSICVLTTDPVFKALVNNANRLVPSRILTAGKWATRQR